MITFADCSNAAAGLLRLLDLVPLLIQRRLQLVQLRTSPPRWVLLHRMQEATIMNHVRSITASSAVAIASSTPRSAALACAADEDGAAAPLLAAAAPLPSAAVDSARTRSNRRLTKTLTRLRALLSTLPTTAAAMSCFTYVCTAIWR